MVGRGVPGVVAAGWVRGGCYTGYPASLRSKAYLMNYIRYSKIFGSYGRLTGFYVIFLDLRYWDLGPDTGSWILDLDLDLDLDLRHGPSWPQTGLKTDLKNLIS